MTSTLPQWLAGRTESDLASIIERRSDVLSPRPPEDLDDLAERLHYPQSIRNVLYDMPQPCLELLETLLVFGSGGMSRAALAGVLHCAADDRELDAVLNLCAMWALAWEVDGKIWVPGALRTLMPSPLRLGPPVSDLLSPRTIDDLRVRAHALGFTPPNRKAAVLAAIEERYADGDAIRALVAMAPADQRELLEVAAFLDPVLRSNDAFYYPHRPDPALSWLIDHGLLIIDWQRVVVPREVGLAIRGAAWHPTLTATQPAVPGMPVGVEVIDRDAAAAANTAIEQFGTVVDACGNTPLAILKSGGVGVREIRRLAKTTTISESTIRLWLEIAYAADMIDVDSDELVPTPAFDEWLALRPSDRLGRLVEMWLDLATVPLLEARPDGVVVGAALMPDTYGSIAAELRGEVLQLASTLPEGTAVDSPVADSLRDGLAWRRPVLARLLSDVTLAIDPLWAEAGALGLIGRNAVSSLGRALSARDQLYRVAGEFAHDSTNEAIFQADLTVVVPGTPAATLAHLLDSVADRESRGAAGTWRCSPSSIRRALDAGMTADDLIEALRRIAVGGALPQPLEYLIADVARRHGALRVRSVGCILRADDPALLAEIASTRSLGALQLSIVAPTVLASSLPIERTLAALRSAGYAPVGESADGVPQIERRTSRRTAKHATVLPFASSPLVRQLRAEPDDDFPLDADQIDDDFIDDDEPDIGPAGRHQIAASLLTPRTRHLIAVPEQHEDRTLPAAPVRIPTLRVVQRSAVHLNRDEQHILAQAIDNSREIRIEYVSNEGKTTNRVIQPLELDGSLVIAWCLLRDDERAFSLGGITSVEPA